MGSKVRQSGVCERLFTADCRVLVRVVDSNKGIGKGGPGGWKNEGREGKVRKRTGNGVSERELRE